MMAFKVFPPPGFPALFPKYFETVIFIDENVFSVYILVTLLRSVSMHAVLYQLFVFPENVFALLT